MALKIKKKIMRDESRVIWSAEDAATNKDVVVKVSHEALQDHGEDACLDKAKEKYDGSTPVDVTTSDF